ncbi:hypothetical protein FRC01_010292, partial [Tulasnella sp. 417]
MDSTPDHSNRPTVGLLCIPDDVIIYILDFLDSATLAAVTQANQHLQELATPPLYRDITIPWEEGQRIKPQESAARLIRTLSKRPSLKVLVQSIENAPSVLSIDPLERVWSEHTDSSELQDGSSGGGAPTRKQLCRVPLDVMKSCVNLRSVNVVEAGSYLYFIDQCRWLNFLLDPSICLKHLKFLNRPEGRVNCHQWNGLFGCILDVQLSLECLDCPVSNRMNAFEEGRMEKWAPNLRALGGGHLGPFKVLLSNKRSIEKLVVRSIPMEGTSSLLAERLEAVDTVKEIVYRGRAKDELVDFPALFGTVPSLRTFRGEVWLDFPTEDDFLQ